ncbi:MAG: NADH-quinone oxidoreductase subunit H [Bacteroidales bacterium]|jgi:NADH-quinone oxidoreductase subunit H|nr:NADH-quinone oxidoreductase subunit H [Bacteroidota bacterium]MCF8347443.1 NADH-quinone oxidoreductase subunit H [Bacteroidales bacterium]
MDYSITKFLWTLLGLFIVLNWGMLMSSTMRRIGARVSGRFGIPWYQPWIDLTKLYSLKSQVSHGAMFFLGPVFRLMGGVGIFLFLPIIYGSDHWSNYSFSGDLILILYFQFFGMLGMALGAGEGGHPHSAIGISRGLSQFTTIEVPMTLAVISLAIQYQTLSISDIVAAQQGGFTTWTLWTNPLATAAGMLSLLGAFGHSPFNLVKAPNEIPIGPPTEYHGVFLGVLRTNGAILHVAEAALFMNLFFGGATNWVELIVKTFLIYFWSVFVGTVFPRFRIEQSVRWFLKVPTIIGIIAIIIFL